jgi:hypothetical protein
MKTENHSLDFTCSIRPGIVFTSDIIFAMVSRSIQSEANTPIAANIFETLKFHRS